MLEIVGDFWKHSKNYEAIVCTTNGIVKHDYTLVMGAGLALEFAKKYPWLSSDWGHMTKIHGSRVFASPNIIENDDITRPWEDYHADWLIAFPTKTHYNNDSSLSLIETSARQLREFADTVNLEQILMTRVGCGLGRLSWDKVKPVLEKYLDDRFKVISKVPQNK